MTTLIEKARQSFRVGERTFRPTPNVRNPAMLAEAEEFAALMTGFKAALRRYQGAIAVFLKSIPSVARGNLPRVWEAVEGGLCEPLRPNVSHAHPTRVGGEFDEGLLRDARDLLESRLAHDVVRPIDRWLESLAVVRTRMRKLEGMRLDVDSRRRRAHRRYMRAVARVERGGVMGGALGGGGGGAAAMRRSRSVDRGARRRHRRSAASDVDERGLGRGSTTSSSDYSSSDDEDEMERLQQEQLFGALSGAGVNDDTLHAVRGNEDFMRASLYNQRKLDAVQASYREQEQLVWEHLSGLVRDAAWLKAYAAGALLAVKDALQASAVALGPCKLPLPAFPRFNTGAEYGTIGDPTPLIADTPEMLKRAPPPGAVAPGSLALALVGAGAPGVATTDVAAALRPKRMTAQPLQASADLRTPRYAPVPPVVRGMPGVPLDEVASGTITPSRGAVSSPVVPSAAMGTGTGTTGGGGGVFGAVRSLAHEVAAAAKQGPIVGGVQ